MAFATRRLFVAIFVSSLAAAPFARAQSTRSWTGLAPSDNNWTTLGNWNTGIPISGDTALFDSGGNANTSISLGAATQPIKTIRFDGAAATTYTLGVLASGDKFNFDAGGSIVVASNITGLQTINAAVQANGALTITNSGSVGLKLAGDLNFVTAGTLTVNNAVANTTTTLGGNISDAVGQPGSLTYGGVTGGISLINGTNTYTGATLLNGFSTVKFSSDSPFGVGTLTPNNLNNNILVPLGGNRTIANPVSMVFGLTVANDPADTTNLTLTGPISMLTNGRFLTNSFTASGGTLTLGSAASPSTITLPTSSGQTFVVSGTGTTVINDLIQNPTPAPGSAPSIDYSTNGTVALNAQNTYTGNTSFNGLMSVGTTFRIGASSNALPGPTFTAGPFGTGAITINNAPPTLKPIGADRSIANAITLNFGFIVANGTAGEDPTGPHNLTLTGPITLPGTGRNLTNNMSAGVALTLGSPVTPSTLSLGSTLTIQSTSGGTTIINDAISGIGGLTVQNGAVVQLNGASSYAGTTSVTGSGIPKLIVNGTKTGTGAVNVSSGGTLGGTGTIAGPINNSGKIAPGNSVGTLSATGDVTMLTNSRLQIELSGTSADVLAVGGKLDLSNVDFLDVTGVGQGLSWVIATYGTLSNTFNTVTPGYTVNYGSGTNSQITLNKAPSGVNGDFNNDGQVDAADYDTWRKFNTTTNALPNDNGLGTPIGPNHYTLWRSNYGKPPGSGSGELGGTVPEPTTGLLILFAIAGLPMSFARRRIAK